MTITLAERLDWLQAVGAFTEAFRCNIADLHFEKAVAAIQERDEDLARWHFDRERGQRERIERVEKCGRDRLRVMCRSCGDLSHEIQSRCGHPRLCPKCRAYRRARGKGRFREAYPLAKDRYGRMHFGGNQVRDCFYTITVVHTGSVAMDIRNLYDAWPRFRNKLTYWLQHRMRIPKRFCRGSVGPDGKRRPGFPYVRVSEISASDNGHAHFHIWGMMPYVHHSILRRFWGEALRDVPYVAVKLVDEAKREETNTRSRQEIDKAAKPRVDSRKRRAFLPWPNIDVREAKDVQNELFDYLLKDWETEGGLVSPFVCADWYAALEKRRLITASIHFWLATCEASCVKCGTVGFLRIEVPQAQPPRARGPPVPFVK